MATYGIYQGRGNYPPKPKGATRFVVVSDTHNRRPHVEWVPDWDVFIHCGDITMTGRHSEFSRFRQWLTTMPPENPKIVIAGNHDIGLDREFCERVGPMRLRKMFDHKGAADSLDPSHLFDPKMNIHYLQHGALELKTSQGKIKIFGSPYVFKSHGWAFGYEKAGNRWKEIPKDTEILLTHMPPSETLGAISEDGEDIGCPSLGQAVRGNRSIRLHLFGHCHEAVGVYPEEATRRVLVNVASLTRAYNVNKKTYGLTIVDRV